MSKPPHAKGWALFDLDQTIVPWDLQVLFCNFVLRREGWRRILLLPFFLLLPLAKVLGSQTMKRVFMGFAWRLPGDKLSAWGRIFAAEVVRDLPYPEVVAEIERHRAAGDTLVLVSASPELYVCPIGEALGFDHTFGTVVEVEERLRWFPPFPLGNNKGANKVVRLQDELGLQGVLPASEGYSDSKADLPMLALCEKVTAIHPEGLFAQKAADEGWRVLTPAKPWGDRREFAFALLLMMLGLYRP
ncbi:HAD-IB family phosphatase [Roseibacillus ishigakijimensis]|uniref:HAD-IB family phosphatase n=1 Tax=Roseibacillus ishigakijimensis TaxID=454146 RepID=A0A934RLA1_9BACT|nr:HAD-IB family phosphatase [Roseibacillus ishigakijimensis]MBK1832928.1 HAD-IB family phosphatase [Roseibacillus ishigakijimensis]